MSGWSSQDALPGDDPSLGSGDGRIHVIPSIAPYSVKNGETLTVTAIVTSTRPVATVSANLGGVTTVTLTPNERLGGLSPDGTVGIWTAEWVAQGLEELVYAATVTITDIDGHSWTDHSLTFSDPAAGNSTVGSPNYPNGGLARVGGVLLDSADDFLAAAVIDAANRYAYFGTLRSPGRVIKVALGSGSNPPTRVGAVTLEAGENILVSSVIDAANGYAYFGTATIPGRVVKVALGSGSNPPTRVGAVTLDAGEDSLTSAVIDTANGYAYFGTATGPGRVVKVALGSGSNPPSRVGAITLETGENSLLSAVVDTANGYAYFGTFTVPGRVVKVALGSGSNPPSRIGAVTLEVGEDFLRSAVIDAATGYAYFGTDTSPGRVVKVALGSGSNPPTRIGAVTLQAGEDLLRSAVIDTANGAAYFGTDTFPGRVVKVALGSGINPPTRIGAVTLETGETNLRSSVIDAANGYAFFGTANMPGRLVKVGISQRDQLKGTRFTLPEEGVLTDVRFHSHRASGNVRLSLYDNNEPKTLLWQSNVVPNTAENTALIVPIANGTPSSLTLPAGTYWAAWQVDSTADVPSFTEGTLGDGFLFRQEFGPAPATLAAAQITLTNERWTQWITYDQPRALAYNAGPNGSLSVTAIPNAGYSFINWSDGRTDNPRTDPNVINNAIVTANFADITAPTSSGNAAPIQVGGAITGGFTASDDGSGIDLVTLFVREPGAAWSSAGTITGGTWSFTPTATGDAADGLYRFAIVATDLDGNSQTAPAGNDPGDFTVLYNDAENSNFSVTFTAAGSAQFPMTATEVMEIALSGVTAPVTITVNRTVGDLAPAGFAADRLIDETLSITGDLEGASAMITWNHAPASINPPGFSATLNTVFQFSGAAQTGQFAVTPVGNSLVFGPVTSFSDWYAGSNDATVGGWRLLAD